ncbi:MAG: PAS domain S-box protein, partial [Candidatus Angelobacter sp.]
ERADMVTGKNVYDLIAPEDRDRFREFNQRVCRGEKGSLEFDIVGLKGVRRHMETHAAPLRDRDGSVVQLAITRDITPRHEAEDAQRRLAAIVESSDDAIASKDLNGIVTSWNKSAERLFGYKAEEMIGQPITLVIPPELHHDEPMILSKIRRGERIDHFETVRVRKNGERIDVSLTISPVKDAHGNVVGAAKIVRNITENRKIDRALRTTEKLAAAGRLAATVAHEINNPLAAVTNLVYLAKRDAGDAKKVSGYLELAGRELERVAHIARQTLGFYRETSSPIRFNVAQALDDLLLLYATRLEARKIRVVRQYDKDIEITALAGEIRQAFSNIVTNAIDAMPEGGSLLIRVSKSRKWDNIDVPGVRVTILDTGSGIAPQHVKDLFQPFFTTKEDVGTGLGLWITRNIIEKHGGAIHVRSRTGPEEHGTVFSIFLPLNGKDRGPGTDAMTDASSNSAISSGVANA